jgi:transaldolase
MSSRLHQLSALGQSVWIDYLSRDLIESGALARAVEEDAVVGVTSNPSIFQKALAHGHAYDEQIAASNEDDAESVFLSLALRDVAAACDLLRPVWEQTEARDGYVSIEVEPTLAADTGATIAQATRFHEAIARPNLLVKIPATDAGVPAIEEMTAHGYSINVTLIFSLSRHSTKDPSLRDTLYIDELIGPETISTMPAETIEAFQDHGRVEVRLESDLQEAQYLFKQLYAAGVDYDDVVATLEREGIDKFVASFNELLQGIAEKRQQLASAA